MFLEMKKIVLVYLLVCFGMIQAKAQADISFDVLSFDFGTVSEGTDTLWHSFIIKNTGSTPLEIKDIKTSCDCTLAEWPKTPIQPGRTAIIRGGFKTEGKSGTFEKNLIIMTNTSPAVNIITIKGNIVPKSTSP